MGMSGRLLRPRASSRYASLRASLVAYWPLEEDASSGDVSAVDWTGRGNDLTSNNTVPSLTGKVGSARSFTAANSERLSAATDRNDLRFMDGRDWTFCCWLYMPSTWPAQGAICSRDGVSAGQRETLCDARVAGGARRIVWETGPGISPSVDVSVGDNAVAGDRLAVNAWHFYAATYTNSTRVLACRINAGTQSSESNTGTLPAGTPVVGTRPFNLGARPAGTPDLFLTGYLDEVAKWDRVLSAAELNALYNGGSGIDLRR